MKKINTIAVFLLIILFSFPVLVAGNDSPIQGTEDVYRVLGNIGQFLYTVFLIVTVIFFILAGFIYVTASGDPKKIEKATNMIKFGVIGVVVVLMAGGITGIIEGLLEGDV